MIHVFPLDVSARGLNGTLKSPPKIKQPVANPCSSRTIRWQNVTCALFGKYTFAKVTGVFPKDPFRKMNLPSGSEIWSVSSKGVFLPINIDTPLDLESLLVAWNALVKYGFVSLGT